MRLPPEEAAALRESFRRMTPLQKADYIFTYYKWYILAAVVVLGILGNTLYREITRKDTLVYCGLVNVAVGSDLEQTLTQDYLEAVGADPKKEQVLLYTGLYVSNDPSTEDHQFAYASRMKIMASINSRLLDVVMMNREAYDVLSANGYLLELTDLSPAFADCLTENQVILEDNSVELQLGEAEEYQAVIDTVPNALDGSGLSVFRDAGFPDAVYLGIIANTPRTDASVSYLEYLATP